MLRNFMLCYLTVTWAGLLCSIEKEQRLGLNLEEILSNCVGAEVFIQTPSFLKKCALEHALPGQPELWELILEHVSDYQVLQPTWISCQFYQLTFCPSPNLLQVGLTSVWWLQAESANWRLYLLPV